MPGMFDSGAFAAPRQRAQTQIQSNMDRVPAQAQSGLSRANKNVSRPFTGGQSMFDDTEGLYDGGGGRPSELTGLERAAEVASPQARPMGSMDDIANMGQRPSGAGGNGFPANNPFAGGGVPQNFPMSQFMGRSSRGY